MMKIFEEMFHEALAKAMARGEVQQGDVAQATRKALQTFIPGVATVMTNSLKRRAPKMLRDQRVSDAGFAARNYRRWKKPFDLLELMWVVSQEVGQKFNETQRPAAIETNDYQFEALVSLHARALLIAREAICLMHGGFPDGALSRWRSLHEVAVTAVFLRKHDQATAHRYLASFPFAAYRAATQLEKFADRAKMQRVSAQEMGVRRGQCEAFARRCG